jgi:hypothetical protein
MSPILVTFGKEGAASVSSQGRRAICPYSKTLGGISVLGGVQFHAKSAAFNLVTYESVGDAKCSFWKIDRILECMRSPVPRLRSASTGENTSSIPEEAASSLNP